MRALTWPRTQCGTPALLCPSCPEGSGRAPEALARGSWSLLLAAGGGFAGSEGTQVQGLKFPFTGKSVPTPHCCGPAPLNYVIAYLFLLGLEILEPSV